MSDYYLKVILLKECPYSIAADKLLDSNNIHPKKIWVDYNDKEKFITNEYQMFPQIYLRKHGYPNNLLLGGYTDLKEFIETFKNTKLNDTDINNFLNKKKNWSKKSTLRFIQFINS